MRDERCATRICCRRGAGSIGDMLFFHSFRREGLVLDILGDIRAVNMLGMKARHSGAIIIGGGPPARPLD